MDLGASPTEALRLVLLPLLAPAIFVSLMVAFAISIDDFVISAFLVAGRDSTPIPVLLYSAARLAPSPALNALASVLLFTTLGAITLAGVVLRSSRKRRQQAGSSVQELARLEI